MTRPSIRRGETGGLCATPGCRGRAESVAEPEGRRLGILAPVRCWDCCDEITATGLLDPFFDGDPTLPDLGPQAGTFATLACGLFLALVAVGVLWLVIALLVMLGPR